VRRPEFKPQYCQKTTPPKIPNPENQNKIEEWKTLGCPVFS
jgi:hypothetical protein